MDQSLVAWEKQEHRDQASCEEELWYKWVDEEHPDAFGFLDLAKDGGFSEVHELYFHSRWLSVILLFVFVIYNVISVLKLDVDFIAHPERAAEDLGASIETVGERFYISRALTEAIAHRLGVPAPRPVSVIGFLELLGLCYFVSKLLHRCCQIFCQNGLRKWYAVQYIFWESLPILSVYSAMRLLNGIVPVILLAKVSELISETTECMRAKKPLTPALCKILTWLLKLIFGAIVGFDTFLMKLRVVSAAANKYKISAATILPVVQFLVQVFGVVQLGTFVRGRLFLFIFGGEDGIMQTEEKARMDTWNALLAKRMHRDLNFLQFIAVMASFSDEDFQSLVLNEKDEEEAARRCEAMEPIPLGDA